MFVYFAVVMQQLRQHLEFVPFYFPMGSFIRSSDLFSSCLSFVFHIVLCDGCSSLTAGRIVGVPCQAVNGLCFCLVYVTWGEFGGFGLNSTGAGSRKWWK